MTIHIKQKADPAMVDTIGGNANAFSDAVAPTAVHRSHENIQSNGNMRVLIVLVVAYIVLVALTIAGPIPELRVFDASYAISRITIQATVWRVFLFPSSTFLGDIQDVALDVINLVTANGLSDSAGRRLAAVFLFFACFIVACLACAAGLAVLWIVLYFVLRQRHALLRCYRRFVPLRTGSDE